MTQISYTNTTIANNYANSGVSDYENGLLTNKYTNKFNLFVEELVPSLARNMIEYYKKYRIDGVKIPDKTDNKKDYEEFIQELISVLKDATTLQAIQTAENPQENNKYKIINSYYYTETSNALDLLKNILTFNKTLNKIKHERNDSSNRKKLMKESEASREKKGAIYKDVSNFLCKGPTIYNKKLMDSLGAVYRNYETFTKVVDDAIKQFGNNVSVVNRLYNVDSKDKYNTLYNEVIEKIRSGTPNKPSFNLLTQSNVEKYKYQEKMDASLFLPNNKTYFNDKLPSIVVSAFETEINNLIKNAKDTKVNNTIIKNFVSNAKKTYDEISKIIQNSKDAQESENVLLRNFFTLPENKIKEFQALNERLINSILDNYNAVSEKDREIVSQIFDELDDNNSLKQRYNTIAGESEKIRQEEKRRKEIIDGLGSNNIETANHFIATAKNSKDEKIKQALADFIQNREGLAQRIYEGFYSKRREDINHDNIISSLNTEKGKNSILHGILSTTYLPLAIKNKLIYQLEGELTPNTKSDPLKVNEDRGFSYLSKAIDDISELNKAQRVVDIFTNNNNITDTAFKTLQTKATDKLINLEGNILSSLQNLITEDFRQLADNFTGNKALSEQQIKELPKEDLNALLASTQLIKKLEESRGEIEGKVVSTAMDVKKYFTPKEDSLGNKIDPQFKLKDADNIRINQFIEQKMDDTQRTMNSFITTTNVGRQNTIHRIINKYRNAISDIHAQDNEFNTKIGVFYKEIHDNWSDNEENLDSIRYALKDKMHERFDYLDKTYEVRDVQVIEFYKTLADVSNNMTGNIDPIVKTLLDKETTQYTDKIKTGVAIEVASIAGFRDNIHNATDENLNKGLDNLLQAYNSMFINVNDTTPKNPDYAGVLKSKMVEEIDTLLGKLNKINIENEGTLKTLLRICDENNNNHSFYNLRTYKNKKTQEEEQEQEQKRKQQEEEESIKNIINNDNLTHVGKIHFLAGLERSDAVTNEIGNLLKDLKKAGFDTIVTNLNEYDTLTSFDKDTTKSLNDLFSNALEKRYNDMCEAVDSGWKSFDSIFGNVANKNNELYEEIKNKDKKTKESVKEVFGKINSNNNLTLGDKISKFNSALDEYKKTEQYQSNLFGELVIDKLKLITDNELAELNDLTDLGNLTAKLNDNDLTNVLNTKLKAFKEEKEKEQAEQADLINKVRDSISTIKKDLGSIVKAKQEFFSKNGQPDFQTTKKYAGLDENVNIDSGGDCILYTDNALNKLLNTLQSECRDTVERKGILNLAQHNAFVINYNKLLSEVLITMLQNDITDARYTMELNKYDFNKKIEDLTNEYEDKFAKLTAEFEGKIKQQNTDLNNKIDQAQEDTKKIIDDAKKDFTSEIEKLKTEIKRIEDVENRVGALEKEKEKENKDLKEQNDALENRVGDLENRVGALEKENTDLKGEFEKFKLEISKNFASLSQQIENLKQDNENLKKDNAHLKQDNENLKKDNEKHSSDILQLKKDNEQHKLDINQIIKDIEKLNKRVPYDTGFEVDTVANLFTRGGMHIDWQRPTERGTNPNKAGNKEIGNKEIGRPSR